MDRHVKSVHPGEDVKRYQCKYGCGYAGTRLDNLNSHMVNQHGHKYVRTKGKNKGLESGDAVSMSASSPAQSTPAQSTPSSSDKLGVSQPVQPAAQFSTNGQSSMFPDASLWLSSGANISQDMQPVSQVASTGESPRLMQSVSSFNGMSPHMQSVPSSNGEPNMSFEHPQWFQPLAEFGMSPQPNQPMAAGAESTMAFDQPMFQNEPGDSSYKPMQDWLNTVDFNMPPFDQPMQMPPLGYSPGSMVSPSEPTLGSPFQAASNPTPLTEPMDVEPAMEGGFTEQDFQVKGTADYPMFAGDESTLFGGSGGQLFNPAEPLYEY